MAINTFHMSWIDYKFYVFPPFSIVSQVLQKIQREGSEGLVIVPKWPTQTLWLAAMQMLVQRPIVLTNMKDMLFLPSNPAEKHLLHERCYAIYQATTGKQRPFANGYRSQ